MQKDYIRLECKQNLGFLLLERKPCCFSARKLKVETKRMQKDKDERRSRKLEDSDARKLFILNTDTDMVGKFGPTWTFGSKYLWLATI